MISVRVSVGIVVSAGYKRVIMMRMCCVFLMSVEREECW